ncbi:peptide MFS transporter [Flavobacterium gilvum]|uniref:MFS transporter n=1 Tax=Flavobacterium gilvum TaxID=1492737 RepID=A0AAC9I1N8_9FLAO|nr:peptide MFS transporter [Flavobacterium gilvum]AOW08386.1 MFS transporter [Flavobacterium gilvum]KFC59667.1 Di-/tripeptide transporter [Flavobacterium gilvum]
MTENLSIEQIQSFKGKYPKQLWYLFFSEMWERFSFYGMRGMLYVFMTSQLLMKDTDANLQYGATQAWVYAFTFIGGLFADKIFGFRKSLFWGGLLMIIGSVILAIHPKEFFFIGVSFTIVGTGFFKPNISSMVGKLYKDDDNRRDAGFSLFYAGVNLGALIGGYICIAVANGNLWTSFVPVNLRWNYAFGFASIVMIISLLTFIQTQKSMGDIGLSPLLHLDNAKRKILEISTYVGSILIIPVIMIMVSNTIYTDYFMYLIGPISIVYLIYEMRSFTSSQNKKLIAAVIFMLFSVVFWAFFEQSGGSLSAFAVNNLNNTIFGVRLDPNGVNNSANSLFVIAFAALVGIVWLWMHKRKIEPNTVVKFGLAFLFLAGGFWIFYYTKFFADANGRTSLGLFSFGWFIITFGELCLSPIGMSAMTKLSPLKTQAVIMGMWFLASAYGQYFAGILGANIAEASENSSNLEKLKVYADGYQQLAIYALVAGIVLIVISPLVKKLMQEVK